MNDVRKLIKVGYLVELVGPIRNHGFFIAMLNKEDKLILCSPEEKYDLGIFDHHGISCSRGISSIYGRPSNAYLLNCYSVNTRDLVWTRGNPYEILKFGCLVELTSHGRVDHYLVMATDKDELKLCNGNTYYTIDYIKSCPDVHINTIYDRPEDKGMLSFKPGNRKVLYNGGSII